MKQWIAWILVLCLLALPGCGTAAEAAPETPEAAESRTESVQTEAAEAPTEVPAEPSFDLYEENAVDDSMTFQWYWKAGEKELDRYIREDLMPEYVDKWFENGEILDMEIQDTLNESHCGWVLMGGEPRQDLGWNSREQDGKTVYCRRIRVTHLPHSQDYRLEKTSPSPGLPEPEPLNDFDPQLLNIEESGLQLPKLHRAELYVDSLETCFVLQDPQKLEILQKALTLPAQVRMQLFSAAQFRQDGSGNPLVLDLEGQGQRMILTDARGGAACNIWSSHVLLMPMSIFELFGVPLEAEGYSVDAEGRTLVSLSGESPYGDYQEEHQLTLDRRGNLIRYEDLTRHPEMREGDTGMVVDYTYDDQDRTLTSSWTRRDYGETTAFVYNERGLLVRKTVDRGGDAPEVTAYEYDDQDRLIARLGILPSGEEDPNYAGFFWYDDQGDSHRFWYLPSGEVQGDPPENPVRRRPAQ